MPVVGLSNRSVRRLLARSADDERISNVRDLDLLLEASRVGRYAIRNELITALIFTTGIRATELPLVNTADILHPDGTIKEWFTLPSDVSSSSMARPVFLYAPSLRKAITAWIEYRRARNIQCGSTHLYQGLEPHSPFILRPSSPQWKGFSLQVKTYSTKSGEMAESFHCGAIENLVRSILERAGFDGMRSSAGRASLAYWLSDENRGIPRRILTLILSGHDWGTDMRADDARQAQSAICVAFGPRYQ